MQNLIIYGDSDFAERMFKYIKYDSRYQVIAFTNGREYIKRNKISHLSVIPFEDIDQYYDKNTFEILIAIGYSKMNMYRQDIYKKLKDSRYRIVTYIAPSVCLYDAEIGEGSILMPNIFLGPKVKIGICNIFEPCTTLSHDNKLGDFNYISTSVVFGGSACLGNNCFIGLQSTIKSSVNLADYTLVGSASNILHNTISNKVYVGNPAQELCDKIAIETKI